MAAKKKTWAQHSTGEKILKIALILFIIFMLITIKGLLFGGDSDDTGDISQQETTAETATETEDLNRPSDTDITRITNACEASEDKVVNDTILNLPNESITVVSRSVASQLRNARYIIEELGCTEYHSSVSVQRKEHIQITVDVTKDDLQQALDSAENNNINWGQSLQASGKVDGISTAGIDPRQVLADLEYLLQ
jgi:hypothetical protein